MPSIAEETNGSTPTSAEPYRVQDRPHSQRRKWRIIGIGAGASGLYLAHQVEQRMSLTELVVYEKNSEIGGTWLESKFLDTRHPVVRFLLHRYLSWMRL